MKLRSALVLAILAMLCGCKLVDQTTFAPSPEAPAKPPPPPPAPPVDKRVPLLTIGFPTPNPNYSDLLAYAVQQAEARRPNAAFDVVSVVQATGDSVTQELEAGRGRGNATQVMQSMMALGVPDTRIHLGARAEPGATEPLVRVYIR